MFVIRQEQIDAMAEAMMKRFTVKSILFLENEAPSWCQNQSEGEIAQFVNEMVEVSQLNKVFSEMNIQKIMMWKIEYDFEVPLDGCLRSILNNETGTEDYRLEQFFKEITSTHELRAVTLDGNDDE
jgi:hypothetical protein